MEEHIKYVKECRVIGDSFIQLLREGRFGISEEMREACKKALEAVMWCGLELKRCHDLGYGQNPYPNSKDPSNAIIEPTADGLKM